MNALQLHYVADGLLSGDDILDALEQRRNRLAMLGANAPRAAKAAPAGTFKPLDAKSILARRQGRRQ